MPEMRDFSPNPTLLIPDGLTEIRAMFGDPASPSFQATEITKITIPFPLRLSWDPGVTVHRLQAHRLVAPHLRAALGAIREEGLFTLLTHYGGGFNVRSKRGGSELSVHSWGIAFDFNPEGNALGDSTPALDPRIVTVMEWHGFYWGGRFSRPDGMHFQFATGY